MLAQPPPRRVPSLLQPGGTWMAVDLEVSFLFYPFPQQADTVYAIGSTSAPLNESVLAGWQWAVETFTDVTFLVVRDDVAGNVATRLAYAECSTTDQVFVLIRAKDCQGAGDDLWPQYQAAAARLGQPSRPTP